MKILRLSVLILAVCLPIGPAAADEAGLAPFREMLGRSAFPENDETRRNLTDSILAPAYPAVESPFRILRQISDGRLVQFELRKGIREWYLIFRSQRGEEPGETYPLWGRGTWIIKKDLLTGEFLQAKVFLQDDEDSFVRIFPSGDGRSRLDVHLYGRQLGDDVIIPVAFTELILSPFARITALTDRSIDWSLVFPDPGREGYRRVETLVSTLRPYADVIVDVDDAAIDASGRNVFIESGEVLPNSAVPAGRTGLNCSGYVKWIVDGVYSAWRGTSGSDFLDIPPLRQPTSRVARNPWSESRSAVGNDARTNLDSLLRDPRFGLDWNRNLAYAAEEARIGRELGIREKQVLDTRGVLGVPYREDMGYPLDDLAPVLYQLAATRPGTVYLAAINSRFVPAASPEDANPLPLHQYWHVAILAPWFEGDTAGGESGRFRVAVLDTGGVSESLLKDPGLVSKPVFLQTIQDRATEYAKLGRDSNGNMLVPEVMVHLVRMDIPPDFLPSALPEAY